MENSEKTVKGKKEPKMTVFGNEVRESVEDEFGRQHKHRDGGYIFGLLLIVAGIVFLLNTLGILPWSVWGIIGRLWPILLILVGVDIIFGHSWVSQALGFILTFGALLIVLGIIFMKVSPSTLVGLPVGITNFLTQVSSYLQIR